MSTEPLVEVHDTAEALATAVAGELLSRLADAQSTGAVPQIGLTGGTIADAIHREVARLTPNYLVDWSRVVIWWGDERFVAEDSPDRNALQARHAFLDAVGVDQARVHEMGSTDDAGVAEEAATQYAELLHSHGADQLDLVMLGMGPDGHVASLFPGFPQLDAVDEVVVAVADSPKPPPDRMSLTFPMLNRSRSVWFVVSGDAKAAAVARAHASGTNVHDLPAAGVTGTEETIWFLDRDAASHL